MIQTQSDIKRKDELGKLPKLITMSHNIYLLINLYLDCYFLKTFYFQLLHISIKE